MNNQPKLLSYSSKRLAILFRKAALQHIRRELPAARETLQEIHFLLDWSNQPAWEPALRFVAEWGQSVAAEEKGTLPSIAPAAWIHLSQELAHLIDEGADWVGYLESRWRLDSGLLPLRSRIFFATLSFLALGLGSLIVIVLARHALLGHWDWLLAGTPHARAITLLLIVGRVAGTVLMIEHGYVWGKKAITGRGDEPQSSFLAGGLTLVNTPLSK
ncbi:MAG: hypothetical protein ACXWR1_16070 [Bdellovibrionota bacterium]